MSIWFSSEAEQATKGFSTSKWSGNQLSIDTRQIQPGDIFVALKGRFTDGHNFINEAAANKASVAIVDHIIPDCKIPLLVVKDTLQALHDMAKYKRLESPAKFIGVTGSVGKTSTKQMLHLAFSAIGSTFSSRANYNNKLGLAINLASMPKNCEYAILELGMDKAGEMHELSEIVKPDLAIITNISPCHIENFANLEGIAYAKSEIYDFMTENSPVILNQQTEHTDILQKQALAKNLNIQWCGKNSANYISNIEYKDNISKIQITLNNKIFDYNLSTNFTHLIENSIFAAKAVDIFAADKINLALDNLVNFSPINGRGNIVQTIFNNKDITLIDDSYNANPLSMKAALENLGKYKKRKIAILGDMLELGENAIKYHQSLKEDIINNNIDHVILCGHLMSYLSKILPSHITLLQCDKPEEITKEIDTYIKNHDIILIKASRGINLTKIFYFLSGNKI
jgi:UDP-N-acetylmuramoyl-tripeptide--D-alanyl-D-alanine ligase